MGSPFAFLPSHRGDRFPRSTQEPASTSRRLHAGCRPGHQQAPPRACPTVTTSPWFGHRSYAFDTSSAVHFRSSLRCSPDRVKPDLFPSSLTTTPLKRSSSGWFEACACTPASRGPPSSLVQHGCSGGAILLSAFAAHNRRRSAQSCDLAAPAPCLLHRARRWPRAGSGARLAACPGCALARRPHA
jgi:hypothetical protein